MKAIEDIAAAAHELARRAQPQTAASRLTLRDFQDVLTHMATAAHALGDGIEDRLAEALPPRMWSPARQAGALVNFAAEHLDTSVRDVALDLRMLRDRDPGNLDGQQTRGSRRWVVYAADRFAARCQGLRDGHGALAAADQETVIALLRDIISNLGGAVNHVALLTDAATERSLGCTSRALHPVICARRELDKARQRMDVLRAAAQG